jgi:IS4 transposase
LIIIKYLEGCGIHPAPFKHSANFLARYNRFRGKIIAGFKEIEQEKGAGYKHNTRPSAIINVIY